MKSGKAPRSRASEYAWIELTDAAAYPGRDGAGALVYDGKMWLIGGWNPKDKQTNPIHSDCNNEVWNSADGVTWRLIKPNTHLNRHFDPTTDWEARHTPWQERHAASDFVYQDAIWTVAGNHMGRDVWRLAKMV